MRRYVTLWQVTGGLILTAGSFHDLPDGVHTLHRLVLAVLPIARCRRQAANHEHTGRRNGGIGWCGGRRNAAREGFSRRGFLKKEDNFLGTAPPRLSFRLDPQRTLLKFPGPPACDPRR